MDAITFAKGQIEQAFGLAAMAAKDMTDEQYNAAPGGTSNSAAKSHVHAITSMDFFISGLIGGGKLGWSDFAPKHGLPANPMEIWGFSGTIPLEPMNEYTSAVKERVLDQVGAMREADLDRQIETQFFGTQTAAWILQLATAHLAAHGGDMAAAKGAQGLKGLPF